MSNMERSLIVELATVQHDLRTAVQELNMLHKLVEIRECEHCGKRFPAMKNRVGRFCSANCKVKHHNQTKRNH